MAQLDGVRNSEPSLAELLTDILVSMFEVEDFVRLMIGEAMRGESTARAVGLDLFTSFQDHIEGWIAKNRPDLDERAGAGEVARLLSAMVVGVFILNSAGVISGSVGDVTALSLQRAGEAANILRPRLEARAVRQALVARAPHEPSHRAQGAGRAVDGSTAFANRVKDTGFAAPVRESRGGAWQRHVPAVRRDASSRPAGDVVATVSR